MVPNHRSHNQKVRSFRRYLKRTNKSIKTLKPKYTKAYIRTSIKPNDHTTQPKLPSKPLDHKTDNRKSRSVRKPTVASLHLHVSGAGGGAQLLQKWTLAERSVRIPVPSPLHQLATLSTNRSRAPPAVPGPLVPAPSRPAGERSPFDVSAWTSTSRAGFRGYPGSSRVSSTSCCTTASSIGRVSVRMGEKSIRIRGFCCNCDGRLLTVVQTGVGCHSFWRRNVCVLIIFFVLNFETVWFSRCGFFGGLVYSVFY